MDNLNNTYWYQVYLGNKKEQVLVGTSLFTQGRQGAVFFTSSDKDDSMWQMYPINSTTYAMRSKAAGGAGYLSVKYKPEEEAPGQTRPIMDHAEQVDEAVFWTIKPWGDGTYFMYNGANGSDWNLEVRGGPPMIMSSNRAVERTGQRFSFDPIEPITQTDFLTIDNLRDVPGFPPSLTTSTQPSLGPTGTSSSPKQTESTVAPQSSGLSNGAKAGIGIAVVVVVGLALGLTYFIIWRRRRQQRMMSQTPMKPVYEASSETANYEMYHDSAAKYEMPGLCHQAPVELPTATMQRHAR